MRVSKLLLSFCVLVLGAIAFTKPASANPFGTVSDQEVSFYGMDDAGNVTFSESLGCGVSRGDPCYFNYSVQLGNLLVFDNETSTAPTFTLDNGSACTPGLPAGWTVYFASCNNGYEVFTGYFGDIFSTNVFYGTIADPTLHSLTPRVGQGRVFINSTGFIVADNEFFDDYIGIQDPAVPVSPTPEPSSLILLGTGALSLVGAVRRRYLASK